MKETGGFECHGKINWRCNEILCNEENLSTVKFINGAHILTCKFCGTKRKVITIDKPIYKTSQYHHIADVDFNHCDKGKCINCSEAQQHKCEKELDKR